ncbi:hypothetical protein F2P79_025381 [Pimephales promelas]|nr:hypothetical protein F2P79_025381 [Pimephales promelas]KAG1925663.1 hypothetical protein F2P79_025381 [Pimephales promelas]
MGTNLGLHSQVQWFGRGGLCWRDLLSFFKQCLKGRTPPNVLVIHCGGNDLGRVMSVLMKDLREINVKFPQMKIVFSSINQRRHWRHAPPVKVEKIHKFMNNIMAKAGRTLQCQTQWDLALSRVSTNPRECSLSSRSGFQYREGPRTPG